jgi:mannan endo-1,4-beta-mannosidase
MRDLDTIANLLKKLKDAGVPVLWRPLHEAGGRWFWWGAKGPEACKKLYYMMRDRFINHHGLDNLIWVWSTPEWDWYPGNSDVDILGHDNYPGYHNYDCNKDMYYNLGNISGWQKLLALTEVGPIPDISDCFNKGSKWSYFVGWADNTFSDTEEWHMKDVYYDSRVKNLGEI